MNLENLITYQVQEPWDINPWSRQQITYGL